MEIKNTKNKSKRNSAANLKLNKELDSSHEVPVIQISEKINTENQRNDNNVFVEKDESIFIEKIEKQDNFLSSPVNTHSKFSKIYFINIIKNKKKFFLTFVPWVLLLVLLFVLFMLWSQLSDIKKDPLKVAQAETNQIIGAIGEIMVLPTGETPKIATLTESDMNKVKTQSFFVNAKVGDKLLVYSIARKVILYDPQKNKIVEVANLDSTAVNQPNPSSLK